MEKISQKINSSTTKFYYYNYFYNILLSYTIQNKKSNRCGGFCYMFIEAMTKGMPFLDFIHLFKNNGSLSNDNILLRFIM